MNKPKDRSSDPAPTLSIGPMALLAKVHLHLAETTDDPLEKAYRREIARKALEKGEG